MEPTRFPLALLGADERGGYHGDGQRMSREFLTSLGEKYVSGVGVEIGAGLRPLVHPGIAELHVADRRNCEEFEKHFGCLPDYSIKTLSEISEQFPHGVDFVSAHQVAEHLDNPVRTIAEWVSLLKDGGILFLSIPSQANAMENRRPVTTIDHILEDYVFNRTPLSYESRQHIISFINSCAALENELMPWYAKGTVANFARRSLYEATVLEEHDLHWHTFDQETITATVEAAFAVAGHGGVCIHRQETDDSHILLYRKGPCVAPPESVLAFRKRLVDAAALCDQLIGSCDHSAGASEPGASEISASGRRGHAILKCFRMLFAGRRHAYAPRVSGAE